MSYEFAHPHNAWSQSVAQERSKTEWFYKTLPAVYPQAKHSQRWKLLADALQHPRYSTNFDFLSSRSCHWGQKSRGKVLAQFWTEVDKQKSTEDGLLSRHSATHKPQLQSTSSLPTQPSLRQSQYSKTSKSASRRNYMRALENELREERILRRRVDTEVEVALRKKVTRKL